MFIPLPPSNRSIFHIFSSDEFVAIKDRKRNELLINDQNDGNDEFDSSSSEVCSLSGVDEDEVIFPSYDYTKEVQQQVEHNARDSAFLGKDLWNGFKYVATNFAQDLFSDLWDSDSLISMKKYTDQVYSVTVNGINQLELNNINYMYQGQWNSFNISHGTIHSLKNNLLKWDLSCKNGVKLETKWLIDHKYSQESYDRLLKRNELPLYELNNVCYFTNDRIQGSLVFIYDLNHHALLIHSNLNSTNYILKDILLENEYVDDVHLITKPTTISKVFLTNLGRLFFESEDTLNEFNSNLRFKKILPNFSSFSLGNNRTDQIVLYCIMENKTLATISTKGNSYSITPVKTIKNKIKNIKFLEGGTLLIQTIANEWIFKEGNTSTRFAFLNTKKRTDFEKLDVHSVLGLIPLRRRQKKRKSILDTNQLPACIDIDGNSSNLICFLLQDYSLYISNKNMYTIAFLKINLVEIGFPLKELNSTSFQDRNLFIQRTSRGVVFGIEKAPRLTRSLISHCKLLLEKSKQNQLTDISIKTQED